MAIGEINRYNFLRWKRSIQMTEQINDEGWAQFEGDFANWYGDPLLPVGWEGLPANGGFVSRFPNSNKLELEVYTTPPYQDNANKQFGVRLDKNLIIGKRYHYSFYVDQVGYSAINVYVDPPHHRYTNKSQVLKMEGEFIATSIYFDIYAIYENTGYTTVQYARIWDFLLEEEVTVHSGIFVPKVPPIELTSIADDIEATRAYNRSCEVSFPILCPEETTSFYINAFVRVPSNSKLCIVKGDKIVSEVLSKISFIEFSEGNNYYGSFFNPNIPDGVYQLAICVGDTKILESNPVIVTRDKTKSSLIKFRHDDALMGFCYDLISDFYQQIRLSISQDEMQFETSIEQYKSVTTGKRRNFKSKSDKYYKFEAYYFDQESHDACGLMVEHSYLAINDMLYSFKDGYKISTNKTANTSKGTFERYQDRYVSDRFADRPQTILYKTWTNGNLTNPLDFATFYENENGFNVSGIGMMHSNQLPASLKRGDILKVEFDIEVFFGGISVQIIDFDGMVSPYIRTNISSTTENFKIEIPVSRASSEVFVKIDCYMGQAASFRINNTKIYI